MSTRQYIGARYVPKFSEPIEWDISKSYEALTIVTHNNDTYTSKIPVPQNTPITDTNFWVMTGMFNAQIEEYKNLISEDINNLNNSYIEEQNKLSNIVKNNIGNTSLSGIVIILNDGISEEESFNEPFINIGKKLNNNLYSNYNTTMWGSTAPITCLENVINSIPSEKRNLITSVVCCVGRNCTSATKTQIENMSRELANKIKLVSPTANLLLLVTEYIEYMNNNMKNTYLDDNIYLYNVLPSVIIHNENFKSANPLTLSDVGGERLSKALINTLFNSQPLNYKYLKLTIASLEDAYIKISNYKTILYIGNITIQRTSNTLIELNGTHDILECCHGNIPTRRIFITGVEIELTPLYGTLEYNNDYYKVIYLPRIVGGLLYLCPMVYLNNGYINLENDTGTTVFNIHGYTSYGESF